MSLIPTCLKPLPVALCLAGFLAFTSTSPAAVIFSGGGEDPLQVEITEAITFTMPDALADTELVYFVFKNIYSTDNPDVAQEGFTFSGSLTSSGATGTFSPFSADAISFDVGVGGSRDVNFHWILDGTVGAGETLTLSAGTLLTAAANADIRVPDNLGSTLEIIMTTGNSSFADLDSDTVTVVPEPATGGLLALGALGLLAVRRR